MGINIFAQGLLIGFLAAIPVGPISILCIRRTLTERLARGLASGLGAATADGIFAGLAVLGLTNISSFLLNYLNGFRVFGSVMLIYLGYMALSRTPVVNVGPITTGSIWRTYFSTFLLTLTNPFTVMTFAALLAWFGVPAATYDSVIPVAVGVFIGSALWFSCLSISIHAVRERCTATTIQTINRLSSFLLIFFGILALCIRF